VALPNKVEIRKEGKYQSLHNPSFMWRIILEPMFIIRGGARWCIRFGESIPILNEPWLVNRERIEDVIVGAHYVCDFSVSSLINQSSKTWNQEDIQQVFSQDITMAILRTPLIEQANDNKLIWKADKNRLYSVKSPFVYVSKI